MFRNEMTLFRVIVPARISILLIVVALGGCSPNLYVHDPDKAAQSAMEFAHIALLQRNLDSAYTLVSANARAKLSLQSFVSSMKSMHQNSWPTWIETEYYAPMDGYEGVTIYLEGQGVNEQFSYRFVMDGSATQGYRVGGLWREISKPANAPGRHKLTKRIQEGERSLE